MRTFPPSPCSWVKLTTAFAKIWLNTAHYRHPPPLPLFHFQVPACKHHARKEVKTIIYLFTEITNYDPLFSIGQGLRKYSHVAILMPVVLNHNYTVLLYSTFFSTKALNTQALFGVSIKCNSMHKYQQTQHTHKEDLRKLKYLEKAIDR